MFGFHFSGTYIFWKMGGDTRKFVNLWIGNFVLKLLSLRLLGAVSMVLQTVGLTMCGGEIFQYYVNVRIPT
eukprot:UN20695